MLRVVAYVCALLALAHGQTTNVQTCTYHSGPLPINAFIEGCVDPPCIFPQNTYAVINVIFRAPRTIHTMTTHATAFMLFPILYPLGEARHTCNYLTNTYCPLVQDEIVQYTLQMFIQPSFPVGTSLPVEFRITDGTNTSLMCIRVPLTIAPPLPALSDDVSARNVTHVQS
ncbi:hypothetical protein HW555_011936 [Spodoptera exigua]|uniref:MD-2-related lipid-recognition domain-containing protein n=1 Tax=Spodoptera exigua TaxID=7107 RepID=A0A835G615_SPOEX|nr:hypothetical protein HW555_011936 [Spodoptera exigua]